jgi:hypothetical protein
MLKIREFTGASGALAAVFLRRAGASGQALEIVGESDAVALPDGALAAVMSRYGAPFDPDAPIDVVAKLDVGDGRTLRHVRHLAGYDVIGRDYLVYDAPDAEPLCAMAVVVARALEHLADVVRARRPTALSR